MRYKAKRFLALKVKLNIFEKSIFCEYRNNTTTFFDIKTKKQMKFCVSAFINSNSSNHVRNFSYKLIFK